MDSGELSVGVDLGATNLRVAIGNREGKILFKLSERTVNNGDEYAISNQIHRMIKSAPSNLLSKVIGVGIGSIGPMDIRKGIIFPPNLNFKFAFLTTPLSEKLGLPVYLLNDCVSAVVGEKNFGAGKDIDNLVYITISTGIGGGVYVNGNLLLGKEGNAHEIGHTVIDYRGKLICGCGKPGHWEAYCSGKNLPNFAKLIMEEEKINSKLSDIIKYNFSSLTSEVIFKLAREGDKLANVVVERCSEINAMGFANVIDVYDPSLITVGGSVALNNLDLVLEPIKKKVKNYAANSIPEIIPTPLGQDIVLYGAVATVFNPPKLPKR
ncbi:MAG: ROK family protein [Thermoproteota archaeon]|nr:ROK family protein [Candidatus Brockarchaeota archaeon]